MSTNEKLKALEEQAAQIQADIAELKAVCANDWPQADDAYWTYDFDMDVHIVRNNLSRCLGNRKSGYMCFRTKEAAELSCKQDKAMRMLRSMADGGLFAILKRAGNIFVYPFTARGSSLLEPRFSTEEKALAAIDAVGTELLDALFGASHASS